MKIAAGLAAVPVLAQSFRVEHSGSEGAPGRVGHPAALHAPVRCGSSALHTLQALQALRTVIAPGWGKQAHRQGKGLDSR